MYDLPHTSAKAAAQSYPTLGALPVTAGQGRVSNLGTSPQAVYEDLGDVAPVDLPKLAQHLQSQGLYSMLDDGSDRTAEGGGRSSPRTRPAYNVLTTSGPDQGNYDALGSSPGKKSRYDMLGKGKAQSKTQSNQPAVSQGIYTAVGGEAQEETYDTLGSVESGAGTGTSDADGEGRGYHVLNDSRRSAAGAAPWGAPGYAALQTGRQAPGMCVQTGEQ